MDYDSAVFPPAPRLETRLIAQPHGAVFGPISAFADTGADATIVPLGPLRDPVLFRQVRIDPDLGMLEWPPGADIDPNVLHDWSNQVEAITQRRRQRCFQERADRADPADYLAVLEKAGTDVIIEGDELPVAR